MSNKLFFITICYNNLVGLQRTIDSLLAQTYQNWECIVIDGASKDGTPAYLQQLSAVQPNIRYISEPDKGIYDAMNKGISQIRSCDYFCFLNSGDSLYAADTLTQLDQQLQVFMAQPPAIVYGDMCEEFADGVEVIKAAKHTFSLKKGMFCSHQSMFFHYRYAALRYDLEYKISSDYDYIVRAVNLLKHPDEMQRLDLILSRFDMTGVSNSRRLSGIKEDFTLRIKNGLCSPASSALYAARSVGLMNLKRFSYPLYLLMRSKTASNNQII
ncbi:glycosyltransferase family 2 protein [Thiothrix subterranea]|uniref:Glycosyltransferase family 2 protein n=1 Tax=Thiothrix subterranea TaxID=2735563 RepID=A0AA51R0E2_9GAMM|nr:glycosyltransferase family 2 protein [Thiothrix subterranea]MDQ5767215.1 glycosyltransferase family 2 protein [Thiothrix subterranea]WML87922.1 glycosyltransferase family 2 protein [Thiothrix subterranea]